jgi:hypothetical protein
VAIDAGVGGAEVERRARQRRKADPLHNAMGLAASRRHESQGKCHGGSLDFGLGGVLTHFNPIVRRGGGDVCVVEVIPGIMLREDGGGDHRDWRGGGRGLWRG